MATNFGVTSQAWNKEYKKWVVGKINVPKIPMNKQEILNEYDASRVMRLWNLKMGPGKIAYELNLPLNQVIHSIYKNKENHATVK